MKEQPLISIIIPVYNAERFLNDCVDSVLKQTYSNIEIVLVNDGSRDSSGEICNQYQSKEARIKVIHLENGGVSRARNKGIAACSGEYICFIDSDDTIEPDYIQNFKDSIEGDINIYIQGTRIIRKDGSIDTVLYKMTGIRSINDIFGANNLCSHGYAHGKMYNSSLIKDNKIEFPEDIKFSEDLLFVLECLIYTDKIKYIDKVGYNYFLREGNASSKRFAFKTELACWKSYNLIMLHLSKKYSLDLLDMKSVGEINEMLFSRIRNVLYIENHQIEERLKFYNSLQNDDFNFIYKYMYICRPSVRLGYYLKRIFNYNIMDYYFSMIYKFIDKNRF